LATENKIGIIRRIAALLTNVKQPVSEVKTSHVFFVISLGIQKKNLR